MEEFGVDPLTFKKILARNVAFPLVLSIALCITFILLLFSLLDVSDQVSHSDLIIRRANETMKLIVDSETGLRGYLVTGHEEYLAPHKNAVANIPSGLQDLEGYVSDNAAQRATLEKIKALYRDWNSFAEQTVVRKRNNQYKFGDDADLRKVLMDQIRSNFDNFLQTEEILRDKRTATVTTRVHMTIWTVLSISILLGAIIAMLGRRQLLALSSTYQGALDTQKQQNELLMSQAWLRSSLAELGDDLRGDQTIVELAQKIIARLVAATGAVVGALYVMEESGQLTRSALHAAAGTDENSLPLHFAPGEGLVGQVAVDKKILTLDMPEKHLRVQSALGSSSPKQLVFAPFLADNKTQGVIELGFTFALPAKAEEFLRQCAEMVGVSLRSSVYRERLQELLHQSQQLTEELQTQQEELRVSNEELEESAKILQISQTKLESQHAEMEQTNEQLEEQATILEQQKQKLDEQNKILEEARISVEEKARELAAASQYKSEFLANMSHELRTPLNSTLILAKLLKDNPKQNLTEEQVEFASTIYAAGNDLLHLINDILDLSKVEAGKLDLQIGKIAVPKLLEGMEKMFSPMAKQKNIELVFDRDASAPEFFESDRLRIEQVLKNLLSNAVKFTERGTVSLKIYSDKKDEIAFEVKDTGIGIESSQHSVIFEAFRQADGTTNRRHGGTGLGLSISKNLAQLLGGSIELESVPQKGSIFTLRMPTVFHEKEASPEAPTEEIKMVRSPTKSATPVEAEKKQTTLFLPDDRSAENGKVGRLLLVVEDEKEFAKILYDLSHEMDFQCIVTNNTTEGMALAIKHKPNAIILDLKLPDASGLSLLDRLKHNSSTRHIPVHIISSADFTREALSLGAIGYLMKPTSIDEIKKTFVTLEQKIRQQIKKVLLVEDDAVQRMAIEKLIGDKTVQIESVALGKEGMDKLKKETYDCVIVDLTLPDMSGLELLETMAAEANMSFPPVIVYTGRSLSQAEEDRLSRYSKSIIIKGARSPERLLDEVTLFLHKVESQLSPSQQKILNESRHREKAFEGRKILLVDDDVRNIFALTSALEYKGAKILVARNGREALERLDQEPQTDLVLMDIMMPEMEGYEAMRRIRLQKRFASLPIIAVTAKAMGDDYDKCIGAGANDYLAKPIDLEKLISLMRVWLPNQIGDPRK